MRPLNTIQTLIFQFGGLFLILGAALPLFPSVSSLAPYLFVAGSLMFSSMQGLQRYEGKSVVVRRLRRQQLIGAVLLVVSAVLLLCTPLQLFALEGNEWKVVLLIAAVLELYTAFRIPHELNKEEKLPDQ